MFLITLFIRRIVFLCCRICGREHCNARSDGGRGIQLSSGGGPERRRRRAALRSTFKTCIGEIKKKNPEKKRLNTCHSLV